MTLRDVLREKGTEVFRIGSNARLGEVVQKLVQHNCGSLVICDGFDENETLVGIVTERDILRTVAQRRSFSEVDFEKEEPLVSEIMTRPVITGSPEDSLEETMELMTQQRIRHLPLQEKGKIVGLVSIGDIVKAHRHEIAMENHYLKNYLHG